MVTRVRLIALLALLPLALAGCGNDEGPTAGGRATATVPFGASAPPEGAGPEEHLIYTQRLLVSHYVDELDGDELLRAAWDGVLEYARDTFGPPAGIQPNFSGNSGAVEAEFSRAVRSLVALAPPGFDLQQLTFAGIDAMAESLDDGHTYFMDPESYDLYLKNETVGLSYSGLRRPDGMLVWYVYPGGPAERAGLRPGDVVVSIDGQPAVSNPDDEEADDEPPYEDGVPARLVVERPGLGRFEVVAVPERAQRRILDYRKTGEVGYLRLYRFPPMSTPLPDGNSLPTYLELAMEQLLAQGIKGWVLDLRNNPGGSEAVAANVAGRLGLQGTLIENRRRGEVDTVEAAGFDMLRGLPLAVLINENSASSSELVASMLQQEGKARIFGQNSSGVVNTSRTWAVAGGGLFITTERAYAGPARVYLDLVGVAPDEAVSLSRIELAQGRDSQLQRALEWLRTQAGVPAGVR